MPLTDQYLARQRAVANRDLPERCTILTPTLVDDDLGEATASWTITGNVIPCRIVPVSSVTGRERQRLDALGQVTDWLAVLPQTQGITSQDQIQVTSGENAGRAFKVNQVLGPHTWEARRLVMIEEVH